MGSVPARVDEARRALSAQAELADARSANGANNEWSEPSIIIDSLEDAEISEVADAADSDPVARPEVEILAKFGSQEPSRLDVELAPSAAESPSSIGTGASAVPLSDGRAATDPARPAPQPRGDDEWGAFVEGLAADTGDADPLPPSRLGQSGVLTLDSGAAHAASPRPSTRPPGPYVAEDSLASAVGGGGGPARLVEPGYIGGAVHADARPGSTQPVWAAPRALPAAIPVAGTPRILPSAAPVSHGQPLRVAPALNPPRPPPAAQEESAVTWWQLATAAAVMMAVGAYVSSFGRQVTSSEAAADAPAVAEVQAPVESENAPLAAAETDDSFTTQEWRGEARSGTLNSSEIPSAGVQAAAPAFRAERLPDTVDFGARAFMPAPEPAARATRSSEERASGDRSSGERRRREAESARVPGGRSRSERSRTEPSAVPSTPAGPAQAPSEASAAPVEVAGNTVPAASQASDPQLPEQLGQEQLGKVMAELMPTLQACAGDLHGKADLKLTLRPKGVVSYALVDADFAGTREGSCIAQALRRAKFPAFTAPVMRISYPVQL
jgi:hypothetical protein